MTTKESLGFKENDKQIILIVKHKGIYFLYSDCSIRSHKDEDEIEWCKIRNNTFILKDEYLEKYYYDLNEYDIYYTEYAYPILAPISLAEIGTEEELEKYRWNSKALKI